MIRPPYSLALLNFDIAAVAHPLGCKRANRPGLWSVWKVDGEAKPRMRFHNGAGA